MSLISVVVLSLLLGFCMKTADLLDEHGLKWFKFSPILFGILWGIIGALLLVYGDVGLSMFWLATFFTYIIKAQIDYFNHGVAETIILLSFIMNINSIQLNWSYFFYFYILIAATGLFNKYVLEANGHNKILNLVSKPFKWRAHYNLIALLFSIITGYWAVVISRVLFWISYEFTTYYGYKIIELQKASAKK